MFQDKERLILQPKHILQGHPELFFVDSLAPVEEARLMGDRPGRFHYQEALQYLRDSGCSTRHFYYNHFHPLAPFCYYRDYVIVDFPRFTTEVMKKYGVIDRIRLSEDNLGAALKSKDYKTFFALLDSRLALLVFAERFSSIPLDERSKIFWHLYARCDWRLDTFPPDFLKGLAPRKLALKPEADGCLTAYHGTAQSLASPRDAFSWSLDVNTAILHATRQQKLGHIYRTRIPLTLIQAYLPWKKEKEVLVMPGAITQVEELYFKPASFYLRLAKRSGVWAIYQEHAVQLKEELFYRPWGIHGLSHTRNVLFMALLLGYLAGLNTSDLLLLARAAQYHDIGRLNDNFDPDHGKDSCQKGVELNLLDLDGEEAALVQFIIENHCIDDREAKRQLHLQRELNRERAWRLLQVFKDADGLDRIRIMDLDVKQLRLSETWDLLLLARQLLDCNLLT